MEMATKKELIEADALGASASETHGSLEDALVGEASGCGSKPETPTRKPKPASARSTPTAPDGLWARERYCVLVRVIKDVLALSERDLRIPTHSWSDRIALDICEARIGCPSGTFKVQLLSDTEFLLRKLPTNGPELSWEEATAIIRLVGGDYFWCGTPATVAPGHRTKKEAKYDLQETFGYRHARAEENILISQHRKNQKKKKSVINCPVTPSRGRGMTRRSDKAAAKKIVGGALPEPEHLCGSTGPPEDFHSARENSDFEDQTEEELEELQESGPEEEEATESDQSEASTAPSSRASFRSRRSNTENRDKKCLKKKLKATNSLRATNARKGIRDGTADKKGRVVLSMFRDSKKEGALEYADWRGEVEEYIKKGYDSNKIKDAMFSSLEGKARRNYQRCDRHGDLTPSEILQKMDGLYNASVDFRELNARLYGLRQGPFETPKDYYDRMVDISTAMEEYHQDRFQPGELSRMEKECFFAGLREQSKYLVSHMKDKKEYDPVDMLKELQSHEEARYPANTSYHPKTDGNDRNSGQGDRNKCIGYTVWAANVEPEEESPQESDPEPPRKTRRTPMMTAITSELSTQRTNWTGAWGYASTVADRDTSGVIARSL